MCWCIFIELLGEERFLPNEEIRTLRVLISSFHFQSNYSAYPFAMKPDALRASQNNSITEKCSILPFYARLFQNRASHGLELK